MANVPLLMAKLAGLKLLVGKALSVPHAQYFDAKIVKEWYNLYSSQVGQIRGALTDEFYDLPSRSMPKPSGTTDFNGHGNIERSFLELLLQDLDYIFEVRANIRIGESSRAEVQKRVFISHGSSNDWRAVQDHIEKDLNLPTLELAQEANRGRTVLQKLTEESDRCSYAVVVMTGDDQIPGDAPRARQNVMHEIGFFQGKYGLPRVCLLHEEGTDIPSNIDGLVYLSFPKGLISASFSALSRELNTAFRD